MTDFSGIALVVTATGGALAAVISAVVSVWTLKQSQVNAKKTDAVEIKADQLVKKTDEIHTLTDGSLTALKNDLKAALAKMEGQSILISELRIASRDAATRQVNQPNPPQV